MSTETDDIAYLRTRIAELESQLAADEAQEDKAAADLRAFLLDKRLWLAVAAVAGFDRIDQVVALFSVP